MKKLLALFLAFSMVLSTMSFTVFATEGTPTGTLTDSQVNMGDATETYLTAEINNLSAQESVVIKIYDDTGVQIATTTLKKPEYFNLATLGVKIIITGSSSSWETVWEEGNPVANRVPTTMTLFVDNSEMNTADIPMIQTGGEKAVEWADVPGVAAAPAGLIRVGLGSDYSTLNAAKAAATVADENGAITYEIYGKVDLDASGWVNLRGTSGATTINFVGKTDDAEICISGNGTNIIATDAVTDMVAINYSDLTLSRTNGAWVGDVGHANRMFTTWMRGASKDAVATYTNCVFPNGASNNQYGKTVYTNCTFNSSDYYALWIYGSGDKGVVEVTGGTFVADRGVKVYSEDASATVNTKIENSTFEIASKPAIVSSIAGTLEINNVDASKCEYGLLASEPKDGRADLDYATIEVDGEEPVYVAKAGNLFCTDIDYAEAEKTDTKPLVTPAASIGEKNYFDLHEAFVAAKSGETVEVLQDASYDVWNSIWNKENLTINGNGYSVTVGAVNSNGNGDGLFLKATNLVINDLTVNLPEVTAWGGPLPRLAIMYSGTLTNVTVNNGAFGVSVIDEGDATIENCTFTNQFSWAVESDNNDRVNSELVISNNTFDTDWCALLRGNEKWEFTGNTINSTANEAVSILGSPVVNGNDFNDGLLIVYGGAPVITENEINNFANGSGATLTDAVFENNVLSDAAAAAISAALTEDVVSVGHAATINGTNYLTLQAAVDAAKAGETITLNRDVELGEAATFVNDITVDLNGNDITNAEFVVNANVTFTGNGNVIGANGKYLFTVAPAEVATFSLNSGASLTLNSGVYESNNVSALSLSDAVLNFGGTAVLKANGRQAISSINSVLNITGGEIISKGTAIQAYDASKGSGAINISGGKITITTTATEYVNAPAINAQSPYAPDITITNGEFLTNGSRASIIKSEGVVTVSGGSFTTTAANSRSYIIDNSSVSELYVTGGTFKTADGTKIFGMHPSALKPDVNKVSKVTGGLYNKDVEDWVAPGYGIAVETLGLYKVVEAADADEAVSIKFVKEDIDGNVDTAEGEDTYLIKVVANEAANSTDVINRLNSADLTFDFNPTAVTGGAMDYEIIEVPNISVTTNSDYADRYMFSFDLKSDTVTGTGKEITIGKVKVTGYGTYSFAVNATVGTNEVHATTISDNIVDTYIPDGALSGKGNLNISDNTISNVEIKVPTRVLTIQIAFPNSISDNEYAYQDMQVKIDGADYSVVYDLGKNGDFEMTNNGYVVKDTTLVLNNTYNITVTGAGYRTARYTVTMTEDKTLNFWNNVKDSDTIVEVGKESSAVKVTFLAGDIVKDNNINIYDLSAVVSYFGTTGLSATSNPEYAKYDLNRDNKIDSKDVAYVLASWGN